jgi:hypothetical protein
MVALRQKNTRIVLLKRRLVRGVMFRVVITMIVLRKLARSRGNLDAMRCSQRTLYEVRPRKDHRGFDLISDALPFGRLWYGERDAISNAIGYARFYSRSHQAVIRVLR